MTQTLPIRLRTIAAAVVVIASGLIIFFSYQAIINSTDGGVTTLPIISAETDPFRVLPDDAGGAEIPNKGSALFDVLNAENSDRLALDGINIDKDEPIEPSTLMPATKSSSAGFALPEVPEPKTESLYGIIEDLKDRDDQIEPNVEVVEEKQQPSPVVLTKESDDVAQNPPIDLADDDNVGASEIVTPSKKPNYTPLKKEEKRPSQFSLDDILTPADIQKHYYIQLASLKNENDARNAYNRIRDDFPQLVEGLNVFFPKVDLGGRGTFTRIQVGPIDKESEAKRRCAGYTSQARGGTCLVLSR